MCVPRHFDENREELLHGLASLGGKWKVSQNQPPTNREGVARGLRLGGTAQAEVAAWVDRAAPR